jgi:hypothetical protein
VTKQWPIGHKCFWFEFRLEPNFLHKVKIEKFFASLNQGQVSFFTLWECAQSIFHMILPYIGCFGKKNFSWSINVTLFKETPNWCIFCFEINIRIFFLTKNWALVLDLYKEPNLWLWVIDKLKSFLAKSLAFFVLLFVQ